MPFYTFKCRTCNIEEDMLRGMNDSEPICKKCSNASLKTHEPKMKRIFKPNAKPGSKDGSWGFSK
jgi:putative FmdB family regulatory protein